MAGSPGASGFSSLSVVQITVRGGGFFRGSPAHFYRTDLGVHSTHPSAKLPHGELRVRPLERNVQGLANDRPVQLVYGGVKRSLTVLVVPAWRLHRFATSDASQVHNAF